MFSRLPSALPRFPRPARFFSGSPRLLQLGSHMTEDPDVVEHEKQKSLHGHVESTMRDAPGWNERLASVAEADVRERNERAAAKKGN